MRISIVQYSVLYMHISISHSSTFKTAYTDAYNAHYTVRVYTTVFLKMKSSVSKHEKT